MASRYPRLIAEIDFADDPIARHADIVRGFGALSHYRLGDTSGTTASEEISGLTGTYEGGFTLNQATIIGDGDGSVLLNGSTGDVVIGHAATYNNLFAGGYSISAWIKATAMRNTAADDAAGIVCYEYAGSHIPFLLAYGRHDGIAAVGNRNRVWGGYYVASTGFHVVADSQDIALNTWYHFVLVVVGQTCLIYRDGRFITSAAQANNQSASVGSLNTRIGRRWDTSASGTDEFFPGYIDEVSFYKYPLSSAQVAILYASGPARRTKEVNYVDVSDRVRSGSVSRGRQDSVNRVEAGELSLVLNNRDGKLLPEPVSNYLINPSLEMGLWTGSKMEPNFINVQACTIERSSVQAHTGGSSCKMTTTAVGAGACWAYPAFDSMGLGRQYTFSVYVWVPSGSGITLDDVYIAIWDASGETLSGNPAAFDSWQRLTVTRTISSQLNGLRIHLNPESVAGKFMYFDSMQLEPGASASTYSDGDVSGSRWGGVRHQSHSHKQVAGSYPNIIPYRRVRVRAQYGAEQLLVNGGFDKGSPLGVGDANNAVIAESTTGWVASGTNSTHEIERFVGSAPHGNWRLRATPSAGGVMALVSNYMMIDATSAYTVAALLWGSSTNMNFNIMASCYDQHKKYLGQVAPNQAASGVSLPSAPQDLSAASTWEKWGGTITSATWLAGTKFVRIWIQLYNQPTTPGTYYLNAVQFVKGSSAISDADYCSQGYFPIFEGYIDEWTFDDPGSGKDAVVRISATDVMASLSFSQLSAFNRAAESPRTRMEALLLSAAIPRDKIDLGDPNFWVTNNLDEITLNELAGTTHLDYIRQIEASEGGVFWVGAEERYVYKGVSGLRANDQVYVFVDGDTLGADEVPYVAAPVYLSPRNVYNDRTQNNPNVPSSNQTIDPLSIARYWHRPSSVNVIWDGSIFVDVASAHVTPQTDSLELRPGWDPERLWPIVLQLEFGDKIDVKKRPLGAGGRDVLQSYGQTLEGIAHDFGPDHWTVTVTASSLFGDF